jgi:hypothetical protein
MISKFSLFCVIHVRALVDSCVRQHKQTVRYTQFIQPTKYTLLSVHKY